MRVAPKSPISAYFRYCNGALEARIRLHTHKVLGLVGMHLVPIRQESVDVESRDVPAAPADPWIREVYAAIRFRQWMDTADPSAISAEIGVLSCGARSRPHSVSA